MSTVYFITHPEVEIDPSIRVEEWSLSPLGKSRVQRMFAHSWVVNIKCIHASTEKKAIDGAALLAEHLNLTITTHRDLGENDRSSTGYLPKAEFEAVADQFFCNPMESIRGWETAQNAQNRVVVETENIIKSNPIDHPVAIVSHGAVGTLLLCHLNGWPIDRTHDQPGGGGGNFFCFKKSTLEVIHGWRPIDEVSELGANLFTG